MEILETLSRLHRQPVVASLYGPADVSTFLESRAEFAIVANIEITQLRPLIALLVEHGKLPLINVDATPGLAHDRGALAFVGWTGAVGIISTRGTTASAARSANLLAVQKVFVTDRSNLPRIQGGIAAHRPDLVQLMPAPILPHLEARDIQAFQPFIAAGFVTNEEEVEDALRHGAVGISSSNVALWQREPTNER